VSMYLDLFAERFARDRLRAVASSQTGSGSDVPEVLFVCVHNAGRSQTAALLSQRSKGAVHVRWPDQRQRRRSTRRCSRR
jgi:arsenate reductase